MYKKLMLVLSFVVLASMILSGCQPVVQTVVVKEVQTQEVQVVQTQEVVQTQVVEVAKKSFSTPHPVLSNLKVRQALAYCTNKIELLQAAYPTMTDDERKGLVMDTFIPKSHWAYAGDTNITIYPFDIEKGKALLEEAGWKAVEGADYRANDKGEELSIKFTTTSAAFRQAWAAVWEAQMKKCGVRILRFHVPASWWFGDTTGVKRRDFELGAFAWVGQVDPGGQTLYACDQIPTAENNWAGQNDMGWCNQAASDAIKKANNTLIQADRKAQYLIAQQEFAKDVPSIALFNRADFYAYNPKLVNFKPLAGSDGFYVYNIDQWELPGKDTIVIGSIQEPSTLHGLIVDAFVARLIDQAIEGMTANSGGFQYTPQEQKEMSTLESGLAKENVVEVKEGDKILDADGNPQDLKAGVTYIDSDGNRQTYSSGTVKMNQLVVTYNWLDGMTYPDGNKVTKDDFALYQKIACDKESGATSFITCDQILSTDFTSDTSYTATYKPGALVALYYLAPWYFYEADLKLSDGRMLKDVPAKDWGSIKEVAEMHTGVGPYMVSEWKKGESMTLVPNPKFYGGEPKTKKIIFKFITAENAEAQLLSGDVDILDNLTLTAPTETLVKAAAEGKVTLLTLPQATWEHIDINMWLP